jgi:hypothetical protein
LHLGRFSPVLWETGHGGGEREREKDEENEDEECGMTNGEQTDNRVMDSGFRVTRQRRAGKVDKTKKQIGPFELIFFVFLVPRSKQNLTERALERHILYYYYPFSLPRIAISLRPTFFSFPKKSAPSALLVRPTLHPPIDRSFSLPSKENTHHEKRQLQKD